MSKYLVILQCTSKKQDKPCPAHEMYSKSARFRKFYPLAKQVPQGDVVIYSAKYGLIPDTQVIEPYNVTLELGVPDLNNKFSPEEKAAFKENALRAETAVIPLLKRQLAELKVIEYDKIFCVFSKRYKDVLLKVIKQYNEERIGKIDTCIDSSKFVWLQENCGGYFKIPEVVSERLGKIANVLSRPLVVS